MMLFFETPEQRLDRLIFTGKRRIHEDGVACWCPIGKHWFVYPMPAEVTEAWWDGYLDAHSTDHEACSLKREAAEA